MNGRRRKSDYTGLDFAEMLRNVSEKGNKVYFTDIDFIAYDFVNNQRRLLAIIETKRAYMVIKPYDDEKTLNSVYFNIKDVLNRFKEYEVVDSDKTVIEMAKRLNLRFVYVFYDESCVGDNHFILIVRLPNYQNDFHKKNNKEFLDIKRLDIKNYKITQIKNFKKFLLCLKSESFDYCWSSL